MIDGVVANARAEEKAGAGAEVASRADLPSSHNVSIDGNPAENAADPLAPKDGSGIIKEGTQGEAGYGDAGEVDTQAADAGEVSNKPYTKSRPKYGLNQVEDVWSAHVDIETGTAIDPTGSIIVWDRTKSRNGQWDMGHKPGQKYAEIHARYMNGEISLYEFLRWYRNPDNYRPEMPSTNRSHLYENER